MYRTRSYVVLAVVLLLCAACAGSGGSAPTPAPPPAEAASSPAVPAPTQAGVSESELAATEVPAVPPAATKPAATPQPAPAKAIAEATAAPAGTPAPASAAGATGAQAQPVPVGTYPAVVQAIPAGLLPAAQPLGDAVVLAWNNLGMHCYQSDFSRFLVLPPYNVLWAQVIQRGEEPRIMKAQVLVEYNVLQQPKPEDHTNFWQFAAAYGWNLQPGVGLTGKKVSGTMDPAGDHFIAEGVPVLDWTSAGTWDPYPFFTVTVKSGTNTIASTVNVAPASTEMSCFICHKGDTQQAVMESVLAKHDENEDTKLLDQARGGKPVLCNACHADPAMGVNDNHNAKATLSGAMHTWHATKMNKPGVPDNACQSCHPGPSTNCLRGVHAKQGITCTGCHGEMAQVGDPSRQPWVNLPACQSCHTQNLQKATITKIADPLKELTANGDALYRNSKAHGGGGIYCEACHGSTHAIYPATTERDNQQSIRLQGQAGTINQCQVCHMEKPDDPFWHVRGERGGGGD